METHTDRAWQTYRGDQALFLTFVSSAKDIDQGFRSLTIRPLGQIRYTMSELIFHVDNLKCGGCATSIRNRLAELPGVSGVFVDPEAGTVNLSNDGASSRVEIASALLSLGYPEHGTGGIIEKAKSYVSCAVGRIHGED